MKIAYILFDDITLLDFIGVYDSIGRIKSKGFIPELSWDLCGIKNSITDNFGLKIEIEKIKPNLSNYQMIIIPGGFGTRKLQFDTEFIEWLKTGENIEQKVSICSGSLLLGAAGFLKGKVATTNFNEYETLEKYCEIVSKSRIVDDGNVITSGAVSSSLDLGLYLCQKLIGKDRAEIIRKSMDYFPSKFEIKTVANNTIAHCG
ncbi:DJ-1/PfpI family protein [Flavivirga aquimarina]|uniref:DJ-1/PfpI family protein n=1 Tax=Flavivirga aquimarina TaxID=2027862 RepID=A0ABT8W653_9FLAO|nr:DJ-1/PfpI family protein [Flavivirga aquimarina]MDO5968594.1 DJ-1/PfpI family protein [Flavivirga aquimarina]